MNRHSQSGTTICQKMCVLAWCLISVSVSSNNKRQVGEENTGGGGRGGGWRRNRVMQRLVGGNGGTGGHTTGTETARKEAESPVMWLVLKCRGSLPWASGCAPSPTTKMVEMWREKPDVMFSVIAVYILGSVTVHRLVSPQRLFGILPGEIPILSVPPCPGCCINKGWRGSILRG